MKKKLMLAIALIAVVAISVAVLAGCKPDIKSDPTPAPIEIKTVEDFIARLDTADCLSMDSDTMQRKISGSTHYAKFGVGEDATEQYKVIENGKITDYNNETGEWIKDTNDISAEQAARYTIKAMLTDVMELDATKYDMANGVWTLKSDPSHTLSISNGDIIYKIEGQTAKISLNNITVTVPQEAKNAKQKIKTVEDFIARLDTAQYLFVVGESMKICGNIYYNSDVINGVFKEHYTVINGDKATTYENNGGEWTQYTEPLTAEEAAEFTPKGWLANVVSFDANKYNIVNGIWTSKTDSSYSLRILNGDLVVSADGDATISLKKFTLTLPEEAKNATEI